MTRIIVLGEAGDMGSGVVMDLVRSSVDEVYIGDINREAAERLIGMLGEYREKLHYIRVDARDHEGLVRIPEGLRRGRERDRALLRVGRESG